MLDLFMKRIRDYCLRLTNAGCGHRGSSGRYGLWRDCQFFHNCSRRGSWQPINDVGRGLIVLRLFQSLHISLRTILVDAYIIIYTIAAYASFVPFLLYHLFLLIHLLHQLLLLPCQILFYHLPRTMSVPKPDSVRRPELYDPLPFTVLCYVREYVFYLDSSLSRT